jgi:hypothetical protein
MRDLLNLLDKVQLPLLEGVGLTNRKPGEKFKNAVDDIVTFQGVEFYPESGRVDTPVIWYNSKWMLWIKLVATCIG